MASPSSALDHPPPPSAPCQPLHVESQPVVGYPPVIGYPHPCPEPPQPSSPDCPRRFAGTGFARGVLAGLVLFAVLLCTINIIVKVVVQPKLPVFTVTSLSVSDFNASGSALTANWETSVAVDNPNSKLRVRFDDIQCYVYYRDPRDYLAWTTVDPTSVGMKGRGVIDARMATAGASGQPERTVVEDIGRERRSGTVGFALDLEMKGTFRYGSWWTRHVRLPVSCVDLAVSFVGSEPRGALAGDEPRACRIL
ncbi:uncharacterized protein LOC115687958 [Syzygium oleosum]|uniref:uncharacterized protein LOC115687958 n=1 Tax=Syzygium oleosum TaxID=219896 RepID=UPI0024B9EB11|nr:uncharacterized protein LOC115687958 [Syzygium oleosum]